MGLAETSHANGASNAMSTLGYVVWKNLNPGGSV